MFIILTTIIYTILILVDVVHCTPQQIIDITDSYVKIKRLSFNILNKKNEVNF